MNSLGLSLQREIISIASNKKDQLSSLRNTITKVDKYCNLGKSPRFGMVMCHFSFFASLTFLVILLGYPESVISKVTKNIYMLDS